LSVKAIRRFGIKKSKNNFKCFIKDLNIRKLNFYRLKTDNLEQSCPKSISKKR